MMILMASIRVMGASDIEGGMRCIIRAWRLGLRHTGSDEHEHERCLAWSDAGIHSVGGYSSSRSEER